MARGAKENLRRAEGKEQVAHPGAKGDATEWPEKSRVELRLELPYFTSSNSTSKVSVALGGITPG